MDRRTKEASRKAKKLFKDFHIAFDFLVAFNFDIENLPALHNFFYFIRTFLAQYLNFLNFIANPVPKLSKHFSAKMFEFQCFVHTHSSQSPFPRQ